MRRRGSLIEQQRIADVINTLFVATVDRFRLKLKFIDGNRELEKEPGA